MNGTIIENSNSVNLSTNICKLCQIDGGYKIQNTHLTKNCFHGKQNKLKKLQTRSKNTNQNYFVAFHDSGSTPRSYFKDIPNNCRKSNSFVQTANNQKIPVVVTGSVKFGKMKLNDVAMFLHLQKI